MEQNLNMKRFALLFIVLGIGMACETTHLFSHSSCTFRLTYNDDNCQEFSFNACTYELCTMSSTDGAGDTACMVYDTFEDLDWQFCTRQCCDSSVIYPQTSHSLSQCQDYIGDNFTQIMIVIISCSVGSVVIVIVGCIICRCCHKGDCKARCCKSDCCQKCGRGLMAIFTCPCLRKRKQTKKDDVYVNDQISRGGVNQMEKQSQVTSEWKFDLRKEQNCAVCQKGKASLSCGEGPFYHRNCFFSTPIVNSSFCVTCQRKHDNIRLYCQNCFSSFYEKSLNDDVSIADNIHLCEHCQSAGRQLSE